MTRLHAAIAAVALAVLAACGSEPERAALPPLPEIETITVAAAGAGGGRAWDGVVEAVREAALSAQTSGRVTEVEADIDDRVAADAVLLRITAVEQQAGANTARAQLRAAEAAAVEAEQNYRRFVLLASSQYVSRAQLDQVRAARDSAVAARDAARAQLAQAAQQTAYTTVRAPFAGIVSHRHVEPGETVVPGQLLMTVYAPDALRIEAQVPQSEAAAIRAARRARVVLGDGRTVDAAALTVFPAADADSHSVGVRIVLPKLDDAPAPGTTAKIVFPIADSATAGSDAVAVSIPASALAQRGEVSGVYVLRDGRLALRQVRVGQRVGDRVEIVAGLHAGEVIAADPVAAVQALVAQRSVAQAR